MKKICFVVFNLSYIGGIERVNSVITNILANNPNYDITLLSLFGNESEMKNSFTVNEKIHLKWLINEPLDFRKKALKVIKLIENEIIVNQYNIVVTGDFKTYFALIKMKNKKKFKLILWEHFNNNEFRSFLRKQAKKFQMISTDKMVVLTNLDKESNINEFGFANKIARIYNPYSFIQDMMPNIQSKKIITIGRLVAPQKGLEFIVQIGKIIFKRFPDWSWDVYGRGDQYDVINKLIIENKLEDNIHLKGVCYDVENIYPNYSIFGLTSRYEGLGIVLLEAKMSKLPLISFDINCGLSEIIADGLNGYLIPPFNIEAYAEKMMLLMESEELRKTFSENSKIDFDKFTVETIKKEWENLLDSL